MRKWYHNLILAPYWNLTKIGFSGIRLGNFSIGLFRFETTEHSYLVYFWSLSWNTPQDVPKIPSGLGYRDLQKCATVFGWRRKNYILSDDCILGWFFKKIGDLCLILKKTIES